MSQDEQQRPARRSHFKRGSQLPPPGAAARRVGKRLAKDGALAHAKDSRSGSGKGGTQGFGKRFSKRFGKGSGGRQRPGGGTDSAPARGGAAASQEQRLRDLMAREVRLGRRHGRNVTVTMALALVLVLLVVVALAQPIYTFATTLYERQQVHAQLQRAEAENARLRAQLRRWKNPDYVSAQARERLGYLKPGETRFQVLDPGAPYDKQRDDGALATPPRPWFLQIVDSQVQAAKPQSKDVHQMLQPGRPQDGATPAPDPDQDAHHKGRHKRR